MKRRSLIAVLLIALLTHLTSSPVTAHASVFSVEGRGGKGSGFLVDSSGIVLTSHALVAGGRYISVTVDSDRSVAAELLAHDERYGIAALRVHPDAVSGLEPLRLVVQDSSAASVRKGDAIRLPVDATREGAAREGTIRRHRKRTIVHDLEIAPTDHGAPLLGRGGQVVGIVLTRSVPSRWVEPVLLDARRTANGTPPPSSALLNFPSKQVYPQSAIRRALETGLEPSVYRVPAERNDLEFLTPPLIQALPQSSAAAAYRPETGFFEWSLYSGMVEPVVVVQVIPRLRLSSAYGAKVAGYAVFLIVYPVLFLAAALAGASQGLAPMGPPHKTYRLGTEPGEVRLLRNGVEVRPLETSLLCGKRQLLMARKPGKKAKLRKVTGCYRTYHFAPEAFAPSETVEFRVFCGRSKEPQVVPIGDLQDRLWQDFIPYFEALRADGDAGAGN